MRDLTGARLLSGLVAASLALLLLLIATGGPDCLAYLDWAHAIEHGDISRIESAERSPLGLPLTQWSHGPGLFYAIPYLLPDLGLLDPEGRLAPARDFRLMGWIAALALWGGLAGLARRAARDDLAIVSFVLVAAFAGTHLGFYSFHHSSESLSLGCLASIAVWLQIRRPLTRIDVAGIAALFGCLVLVRAHLVLYLPLGFAVLIWRVRRERGSWRPAVVAAAAAAVPTVLAGLELMWVNRWMTGTFRGSTYSFGAGAFRSFDLSDPELLAVLVHPWHGLLAYHPLYALAFALLLAGLVRRRGPERWLRAGVAVTLLVHLLVQSSWYCWWLGLWSLGNRGLGVAAVLLVPWLARDLSDAGPRARAVIAGVVLICSTWSLLLMMQGHTNFVRWSQLLGAQAAMVREIAPWLPFYLAAAVAAWAIARRRGPAAGLLAAASASLAAPLLDHVTWILAGTPSAAPEGGAFFLLRLSFVALAPILAARDAPGHGPRTRVRLPAYRVVAAAAVVTLFLVTGLLFLRLAVPVESLVANGGVPGGGPVATFQVSEVEECYREYLLVPGFEGRKAALRAFLESVEAPALHSSVGDRD